MKKYNKTITVYELPKGFYAEVHRNEGMTDFYMCHQRYAIKLLMFGIPDCPEALEEVFLLNNVPQHVLTYARNYCDYKLVEELENEIIEEPDDDFDAEYDYAEDDEDDGDEDDE